VYCSDCNADEVIREDRTDETAWAIVGLTSHEGTCPACNDHSLEQVSDDEREMVFEELDHIGEKGAQNIRDAGIVTRGDAKDTSDEEFLDIAWVGEAGVESIRDEIR